MKNRLIGMFVTTCAVIVCAIPLVAQEPSPLVRVVRFHVKPDRVGEFRDIHARLTESAKKEGRARSVWRNVNNGSEYGIVTRRDNYASFDAPLSRTMSDTEFRRLIARLAQCYDDRDVVVYMDLPDLTVRPAAPPKTVRTNTTTVRPGARAEYLELMGQLFGQYKKLGFTGYGLRQVQFGGSRLTYMSWHAVEKAAELDGPSWAAKAFEAMGETAASKWREEYGRVIAANEYDIYAYEPDLSFYPAP